MKSEPTMPFIIKQLEEALEERQTPDRRRGDRAYKGHAGEDRRKENRRERRKEKSADSSTL